MKLSEVTLEEARRHAKSEPDDVLDPLYLENAKQYVLDYTGLSGEQADEKPGLALAALFLFSELTDNRQLSTDSDRVNQVLGSFLDLHRVNLL